MIIFPNAQTLSGVLDPGVFHVEDGYVEITTASGTGAAASSLGAVVRATERQLLVPTTEDSTIVVPVTIPADIAITFDNLDSASAALTTGQAYCGIIYLKADGTITKVKGVKDTFGTENNLEVRAPNDLPAFDLAQGLPLALFCVSLSGSTFSLRLRDNRASADPTNLLLTHNNASLTNVVNTATGTSKRMAASHSFYENANALITSTTMVALNTADATSKLLWFCSNRSRTFDLHFIADAVIETLDHGAYSTLGLNGSAGSNANQAGARTTVASGTVRVGGVMYMAVTTPALQQIQWYGRSTNATSDATFQDRIITVGRTARN